MPLRKAEKKEKTVEELVDELLSQFPSSPRAGIDVPLLFLHEYLPGSYSYGEVIDRNELKKALEIFVMSKKIKNKKDFRRKMEKYWQKDTTTKGFIKVGARGEVAVAQGKEEMPQLVKDRASTGMGMYITRKEKYGETWRISGSTSLPKGRKSIEGGYGGLYAGIETEKALVDILSSAHWKDFGRELKDFARKSTLKGGISTGGVELGVMAELDKRLFLFGREIAWLKPFVGLNYGPLYVIYDPRLGKFLSGFSWPLAVINYALYQYNKKSKEYGGGKGVLAGLGEIFGITTGLEWIKRARQRAKGNVFQRIGYAVANFFGGMSKSISQGALEVGIKQPIRMAINSFYRFFVRPKKPKDINRSFSPKEVEEMKRKIDEEVSKGMLDKAKDDVEHWLYYKNLPPAFRGYLMGLRDRLWLLSAYAIPISLFPPGLSKNVVKEKIKGETEKAIKRLRELEEISRKRKLTSEEIREAEAYTVYLLSKLSGIEKTGLFIEHSPAVVSKDEISSGVKAGLKIVDGKYLSIVEEFAKGDFSATYEFFLGFELIQAYLSTLPPEYASLRKDFTTPERVSKNSEWAQGFYKARYYNEKIRCPSHPSVSDVISLFAAYSIASPYFNEEEKKEERRYLRDFLEANRQQGVVAVRILFDKTKEEASAWAENVLNYKYEEAEKHKKKAWEAFVIGEVIYNYLPPKERKRMGKHYLTARSYVDAFSRPMLALRSKSLSKKMKDAAMHWGRLHQQKALIDEVRASLERLRDLVREGKMKEAKDLWGKIRDDVKGVLFAPDEERIVKSIDKRLSKERLSSKDRGDVVLLLHLLISRFSV